LVGGIGVADCVKGICQKDGIAKTADRAVK